ncbi:MAG: TIGR00282 family metallophosphoesterase [Candidatus Krumholzibacteriota bacterium]|nr:TIGR00282 family metallophosphoesterase [Candidatus Krumholzibacteriota bacterium]
MKILFIGDVIARTGRRILSGHLAGLRNRLGIDLCIANAENSAGIFGVTRSVVEELRESGVDIMTGGNHIWDKREGIDLLEERDDLLRPANYPPNVPGHGWVVTERGGAPVAVVNLQGRTFMPAIDCPFRAADGILAGLPGDVRVVVVDFHAEATSEKLAMGYYLDGRVSAVAGTHTHVQTADERILSGGTGYITDLGMTGAFDSIIGVRKEQVLNRFLFALPVRFQVADESPCLQGMVVEVDTATGKAVSVERIMEFVDGEGAMS